VLDEQDVKTVRAQRAIERTLASLFEARGHVWLIPDEDPDFQEQVPIVGNEEAERALMFDCPGAVVLRRVLIADQVRVQAVVGGLLTWFYATGLARRDEEGDCYLRIPYPEVLYRLQRRSAFRIDLPPDVPGTLAFCLPGRHAVTSGQVVNISSTGCAVSFADTDDPGFPTGTEVSASRLKVGDQIDTRLEFTVRNRRPGVGRSVIYGLEFAALPPRETQAIDKAVMQFQRMRLVR
jgi:c-di-GMP-binding flagellar brake protein YcgR